jgi:hypothetical protein
MDFTSIASQGLQQADAQLNSAGSKIASFQTSSPAGANQDTVDLSSDVVALLSAKNLILLTSPPRKRQTKSSSPPSI